MAPVIHFRKGEHEDSYELFYSSNQMEVIADLVNWRRHWTIVFHRQPSDYAAAVCSVEAFIVSQHPLPGMNCCFLCQITHDEEEPEDFTVEALKKLWEETFQAAPPAVSYRDTFEITRHDEANLPPFKVSDGTEAVYMDRKSILSWLRSVIDDEFGITNSDGAAVVAKLQKITVKMEAL